MAIRQYENFIDGRWTSDNAGALIDVIDPATEEVVGRALDGGAKQASWHSKPRAAHSTKVLGRGCQCATGQKY